MEKVFGIVLMGLALGLAFGRLSVAAPNPPEDVDQTITIPAGGVDSSYGLVDTLN